MKHMVRRLARSGGLYVSRYPPPETLAFHLKQLTRRLEINCVLDVGAHVPDPKVLLKVDTQGYDLEVVEGAAEVLWRVAALQLELPVKHVYDGVPGLAVTLERLDQLGFEVTGMFPVTRDRDQLRVIEFDCVLRRKPKGRVAA